LLTAVAALYAAQMRYPVFGYWGDLTGSKRQCILCS